MLPRIVAALLALAGPAFAAGATRQRRSLGLVAANGGTRAVLRRIVLANAMILGALTALVSAVLGTALGVLVLGMIQTVINFQGTLSSWWTRIVIGALLFVFIVLQRLLGGNRKPTD